MDAPVWLLDVDGVINAQRPGWGAAPFAGNAYANGHHLRMRWSPALLKRIRAVTADGSAEVRWCSTWCGMTDGLEDLFKLPPLADAFTIGPGTFVSAADLKLAAARAVLAEGRRLIWTDDDEVPGPGELYDELTSGGRALLIRPSSRRGLQPEHMDRIEAFCRAQKGGEG